MATDVSRLADALKAAALLSGTARDASFTALAQAIIYEITHATVTVTVSSVSGVTAGPGVSGPGTGTGTVT